ncbi:MAG: hypothetical protein HOO99_16550 [Hyphomicrobiaceae bacterium]|nr:hypothetical protein [Hyphomicrobiaceae bacterium]
MYLRFQGQIPNLGTPSKLGIFQLAFELRDRPDTPDDAVQELQKNLGWLKMHLKSPKVLREEGNERAISWFKSGAKEPLKRIWSIKTILEDFGYRIEFIKTKDPGRIIYEDGWQVVAKPHKR